MSPKTALILALVAMLGASALQAQENRRGRGEREGERRVERNDRVDRGTRATASGERPSWGGRDRRGTPERASYAPLELRGMIGNGENAQVSITNPETGESQWVRVRDRSAKWYVKSVNPKSRSAVVFLEGMDLKLEMITNTGEPMSIAPLPTPLSADEAAAEGALVGVHANFDAKTVATQVAGAWANGQQMTPEQRQAMGEQFRAMSPEQRQQVFDELRRIRETSRGNDDASAGRTSTVPVTVSTSVQQTSNDSGTVSNQGNSGRGSRSESGASSSAGGRRRGSAGGER